MTWPCFEKEWPQGHAEHLLQANLPRIPQGGCLRLGQKLLRRNAWLPPTHFGAKPWNRGTSHHRAHQASDQRMDIPESCGWRIGEEEGEDRTMLLYIFAWLDGVWWFNLLMTSNPTCLGCFWHDLYRITDPKTTFLYTKTTTSAMTTCPNKRQQAKRTVYTWHRGQFTCGISHSPERDPGAEGLWARKNNERRHQIPTDRSSSLLDLSMTPLPANISPGTKQNLLDKEGWKEHWYS